MLRLTVPPWLRRTLGALAAFLLLVLAVTVWLEANRIRARFLVPRLEAPVADLEVIGISGGRITLPRTPETTRDGTWGLVGKDAYGQVADVYRIDDTTVERAIRTFRGTFATGDRVGLDENAYPDDPFAAHGFGFDEVRVPGDLGPNPAWLVTGRRSTWVILVHGRGRDRRQGLRIMAALVEDGYPVLDITYRNDPGASPGRSGLRSWGLEEWRDVDAAVALAERKGAADVVLYGYDYGAEIVATFLHSSERIGLVQGVVLDSPVLDLEGLVDAHTSRWMPRPVAELAQQLVRIRFGLAWAELDQVARAPQFDVPVLILHGGDDTVAPIRFSAAFAAARPDLVQLVRFEQARHGDLWNIDPERYEREVSAFLTRIVGPE